MKVSKPETTNSENILMSDRKMGKKPTQELQRKLLTSNVDIVFHKTNIINKENNSRL